MSRKPPRHRHALIEELIPPHKRDEIFRLLDELQPPLSDEQLREIFGGDDDNKVEGK
jgi:hypothetical protein